MATRFPHCKIPVALLAVLTVLVAGCDPELEVRPVGPLQPPPITKITIDDKETVLNPPDLASLADGGPPVAPNTPVPAGVRDKAKAIQDTYGVKVYGDWSLEAIELMAKCLEIYKNEPKVLARLQGIYMTEVGHITEKRSDNLAGLFTPTNCRKDDDGDGECFYVEKDDPSAGFINLWGARNQLGRTQTREDIIQHELGHYFAVAIATDNVWRYEFRRLANDVVSVSDYGNIRSKLGTKDENFAEIWSKLYTQPTQDPGNFPWYKEPWEMFKSHKVPAELAAHIKKCVTGPMQAAYVRAAN